MKTISMILLLCAISFADDTAVRVLAALADDDSTRAAVGAKLDALGVEAIPALDKVRRQVRTPRAQRLLDGILEKRGKEIRKRILDGERRWFLTKVKPMLAKLTIDALWRLHVDREGNVYFDALTFKDPARLKILEYLVAPDDKKAYETLARMESAEWNEFKRAFATGRPILLRWFVWGMATVKLQDTLPWAQPVWADHGMKLGGNHDERANAGLPGSGQTMQIGVVIK